MTFGNDAKPQRFADRLKQRMKSISEAGTKKFDADDSPGLVAANLTGYLASISSLSFAISFAFHDAQSLRPLIVGNTLSAACTAATPVFHRFGRTGAAVWLSLVFFISLYYFTSLLGRDSGVVLNLIGASAVAFAILGLQRVKLVFIITMISVVIILYCWIHFPQAAEGIARDSAFTNQIFANSIISIMAIIFVVIYYAFYLTAQAQAQTDKLLRAIMPGEIVSRLKANPGTTIAERHEDVPVLFADTVRFTELSNQLGPEQIVVLLDEMFRAFDTLATLHQVEKIKTIGDAYMAVCGVPLPHRSPSQSIVAMAIGMHDAVRLISAQRGLEVFLRIGIAQGPLTAGVVGQSKYFYDVWGPAVNLAARLQTAANPGQTLVSGAVKQPIETLFQFQNVAGIDLKGFGIIDAWEVVQHRKLPEK